MVGGGNGHWRRLIKNNKNNKKLPSLSKNVQKVISKFGYLFNIHVKLTPKEKK